MINLLSNLVSLIVYGSKVKLKLLSKFIEKTTFSFSEEEDQMSLNF